MFHKIHVCVYRYTHVCINTNVSTSHVCTYLHMCVCVYIHTEIKEGKTGRGDSRAGRSSTCL